MKITPNDRNLYLDPTLQQPKQTTKAAAQQEDADAASAARIARGRELAADPNYPSPEIILQVAKAFIDEENSGGAGSSFQQRA